MLNVVLVMVALAIGITSGVVVSLRCFRGRPGVRGGALLGGLFTLMGALMAGELVAGRAEELLGTRIGVPIGLAIGCFAAAFIMNTLASAMGAVVAKIIARS